jgi:Hemolysins and related proteins containing CBS domains
MQPSNNNIDENPSFENDKADVPIANEEQKTSLDIQNNSISNTPTITNENLPSDKNPGMVTCSTFTQKEDKKNENHDSKHCDKSQKDDKKKKSSKKKRNVWWIKATVISLVLSAFFSYLSEIVSNAEQIVVVIILLAFLILSGILFDAIGVAVTSCDTTPIISMASRKVYGAKTALWLTKNSDTVSSVCNDIVGDIFSIISGACSAALVVKITMSLQQTWQIVLSIAVSAIVSAMTIGGKAFMKKIAISNSKDFVMFVARVLAIFNKDERKIRKKQKEAKTQEHKDELKEDKKSK